MLRSPTVKALSLLEKEALLKAELEAGDGSRITAGIY
jgi:hypothetical protein